MGELSLGWGYASAPDGSPNARSALACSNGLRKGKRSF